MNSRGMTLVELMVAVAIFVIVMGVLYTVSMGIINASEMQEIMVTTNAEARRALMVLVPRIRQASRNSINWANLPGDSITLMMAADLSGNGFAVGADGRIELAGPITIQRDVNDANNDGVTRSQLVMIDGDEVRVLANDLIEDGGADGGFWVVPRGRGLEITIRAEGRTARGRRFNTTMTEFVVPRN